MSYAEFKMRERKADRFEKFVTAVMVLCVILALTCLYAFGAHVLRPWLDKYPDKDPRQMVYEIRQLNPGLDPGRLQVGQRIVIPEVR